MSLQKNDIPILEYDDSQKAVIMPERKGLYAFPPKAVFPFLADEVETFARENRCGKIGEFISATKIYPIYKTRYQSEEVCFCQAPVGAAAAVQLLDFLIGYGVRQVISAGTCGAISDLRENEFIVPTEALRCEGTSYHYLPPSRTVRLDEDAAAAIERALAKNGVPCRRGKTWTTDGFFRETKDMVQYRKAEGFDVVEMECSALAACARFRGAEFGQILFTADTLANVEAHDDRNWGLQSFPLALKLCFEAVLEMPSL
jgi:uridine phosphorylase